MRRVILALLAVLAVLAFPPAAAAQLKGADRDLFVRSSIQGCTEGAAQNNLSVPADKMSAFCTCMANKQADMTTPADLDYWGRHQALSSDYSKRVEALAPACREAAEIGK